MTALPEYCSHCNQPLGAARLIVRAADGRGLCGQFHVGQCYPAYVAGVIPHDARLRHADLESVIDWERRTLETLAPRHGGAA